MDLRRPLQLQENLNRLLKANSVSLHHLSQETSINKSTLHNYLNGVVPQGLGVLLKLADFFEISIEELLYGPVEARRGLPPLQEGRYEIIIKKIKT